ncbi:MAG TPA: RHS repeat-associated core domain-containing protein, partial [Dyella sp.]|uniref:RHS repeat-associated core domain-containing protein n=1 Tax=Dyella sp. TaxID=1869338 RepID=UPI002C9BC999
DVAPTPTSQPATFDLNDRETSFNGQALSYDADGNLTSDGTNTYTWNARNQLTQVSQNGVAQLSYTYDALGRRISKTVQAGTPTQYLYDRFNAVQETQGSAINPILNGLGIDERFARNDITGRTYYLSDGLNSTIALTDPTGAIREQYSYDPYGNVTSSDTTTGFTNPYQYTGREADSPGLYYYRARYYSPTMGGFISEDSAGFLGGQLTYYGYASGDPLDFYDPIGLSATSVGAAWGAAIGGTLGVGAAASLTWATGGLNAPFIAPEVAWMVGAGTAAGAAVGAIIGHNSATPDYIDVPGNKVPWTGAPGSTVRGGTGSRTYGPDGYPVTDRDLAHPDEAGIGSDDHCHDWGRPSDGGPPSSGDRGPPREPQPGDPPQPRGPNVPPPQG